jgi:hypothetical protein
MQQQESNIDWRINSSNNRKSAKAKLLLMLWQLLWCVACCCTLTASCMRFVLHNV